MGQGPRLQPALGARPCGRHPAKPESRKGGLRQREALSAAIKQLKAWLAGRKWAPSRNVDGALKSVARVISAGPVRATAHARTAGVIWPRLAFQLVRNIVKFFQQLPSARLLSFDGYL